MSKVLMDYNEESEARGRILVIFLMVEKKVDTVLQCFLELKSREEADTNIQNSIINQLGFIAKIEALKTCLQQKRLSMAFTEIYKSEDLSRKEMEIKKKLLFRQLNKISVIRNDIVHGYFVYENNETSIINKKRNTKIHLTIVEFTRLCTETGDILDALILNLMNRSVDISKNKILN